MRQLAGGHRVQVDALEVVPGRLQLVAAGVPDGAVVLQEVRQVDGQPVGPGADLARVGLRDRRAVQVGAGEPAGHPAPGRQRQVLRGALGAGAVAVGAPQRGGQRGQPAGPVEVEEPERVLVARPERGRAVDHVGEVEELGAGSPGTTRRCTRRAERRQPSRDLLGGYPCPLDRDSDHTAAASHPFAPAERPAWAPTRRRAPSVHDHSDPRPHRTGALMSRPTLRCSATCPGMASAAERAAAVAVVVGATGALGGAVAARLRDAGLSRDRGGAGRGRVHRGHRVRRRGGRDRRRGDRGGPAGADGRAGGRAAADRPAGDDRAGRAGPGGGAEGRRAVAAGPRGRRRRWSEDRGSSRWAGTSAANRRRTPARPGSPTPRWPTWCASSPSRTGRAGSPRTWSRPARPTPRGCARSARRPRRERGVPVQEVLAERAAESPLGRLVTPAEVAWAVATAARPRGRRAARLHAGPGRGRPTGSSDGRERSAERRRGPRSPRAGPRWPGRPPIAQSSGGTWMIRPRTSLRSTPSRSTSRSVNASSSRRRCSAGRPSQHQRGEVGRGAARARLARGRPVLGPVQRQMGADPLQRCVEHLGVADADPPQQLGVLRRGVQSLDQVHLDDRHGAHRRTSRCRCGSQAGGASTIFGWRRSHSR